MAAGLGERQGWVSGSMGPPAALAVAGKQHKAGGAAALARRTNS